jgi:hypothetical protein
LRPNGTGGKAFMHAIVLYFFEELLMTKWIVPLTCAFLLAACSSPGSRVGTSTATGSGSTATTSGASGTSGGVQSGAVTRETSPATSGTYSSPGTSTLPGSKGTAGTSVDPSAPGSTSGSSTGTTGVPSK